jgi:hypothetical protein
MKNWKQIDHLEVWPDSPKEKNWCVSACTHAGQEIWCEAICKTKNEATRKAKIIGYRQSLAIRIYSVCDAPAACN